MRCFFSKSSSGETTRDMPVYHGPVRRWCTENEFHSTHLRMSSLCLHSDTLYMLLHELLFMCWYFSRHFTQHIMKALQNLRTMRISTSVQDIVRESIELLYSSRTLLCKNCTFSKDSNTVGKSVLFISLRMASSLPSSKSLLLSAIFESRPWRQHGWCFSNWVGHSDDGETDG